ncbi:hypothetical protein [Halobacteriovorax sp.]|uniref:hypothetical protein n=1 Tax=Halobacteriovorax sp. TaxID=2020862 RepID=UPI003562F0CC
MDLKNFFNILLLAISLTTILVTLVSYIVFKLRLGSGKKRDLVDPLEGAFYRRFSPLVNAEYLRKKSSIAKGTVSKVSVKVKFASLFVFLLVVVSGLFLFEDYFSYRKEISERVLAANNFRELVKKGFLKSYEYTPDSGTIAIKKRFSSNSQDQLTYLRAGLKDKKFCLISTNRARRYSSSQHKTSVDQWKSFFKRNGLSYKVLRYINPSKGCLVIFPHVHSLSRAQVAKVENLQAPSIITGGFGVVDGLGDEVEQTLLQKYLGVDIQKDTLSLPTLVSSEKDYLWEIDGGSFINWKPIDINFSYYLSDKANLISADFNGKITKDNEKVHSRIKSSKNVTWTSLDPIENIYSDLVFLNIFASYAELPVFKIENYKGTKVAFSFIYRQSQQANNLEEVTSLFKGLGSSWTLFTNNYNYVGKDIRKKQNDKYEVSILTSPDHNFDKLDSRASFNLLENIRLRLEELSYSGVIGLTSFDNFLNEVTLDSANQNRLSYLYGTIREVSYSPVFLEGLNYLLIPKMFRNSQEILNDKSITDINDLDKVFKARLDDMELLGGLAVFDLSSAEFENYLYRNSIEKLIKDLKGRTSSFSEIVEWKKMKENLKLSAVMVNGKTKISIENMSERSISNFNILFHGENGREEFLIDRVNGKENLVVDPAAYRDL